jgi:hypothetical protein
MKGGISLKKKVSKHMKGCTTFKKRVPKNMKGGRGEGNKRAWEFIRDPTNEMDDRERIYKKKFKGWNKEVCPTKFWKFKLINHDVNLCKFDMWGKDNEKYVVYIDKVYNSLNDIYKLNTNGKLAKDTEKTTIITGNYRAFRTPDLLREIFPDGFYMEDPTKIPEDEKIKKLITPKEIPDTEKYAVVNESEKVTINNNYNNKENQLAEYSRDNKNPWNLRKYAASRFDTASFMPGGYNSVSAFPDNIPTSEPFKFSEDIDLKQWIGTNNWGFNIWAPDEKDATKKKKFWIDVHPLLNVATGVKDETGSWTGGVDDETKNETLYTIREEYRTPKKIPGFLNLLFPNGYYKTDTDNTLIKEEVKIPKGAAVTPSAATPSAATPSAATPSAAITSESKAPESTTSETKASESKTPETKTPESKAPESKAPESKAPSAPSTNKAEEAEVLANAEKTLERIKIAVEKAKKAAATATGPTKAIASQKAMKAEEAYTNLKKLIDDIKTSQLSQGGKRKTIKRAQKNKRTSKKTKKRNV